MLHLENLPVITTMSATCLASTSQRLPPLPTTSLHGALGHSLRNLAPDLFSVSGNAETGQGVTDSAPPPVILAMEPPTLETPSAWNRHFLRRPFIELQKGDIITFRIVLLGEEARNKKFLLAAALERSFSSGIGVFSNHDRRKKNSRPPLLLTDLNEVFPPPQFNESSQYPTLPKKEVELNDQTKLKTQKEADSQKYKLIFLSPARLTHQGKIAGDIDEKILWAALLRRADTLSRAYGNGPIDAPDGNKLLPSLWSASPPFTINSKNLEVIPVSRYSSRQRSRMTWPGLIGEINLELNPTSPALSILSFCELAQIGKATSFGFGRYKIA